MGKTFQINGIPVGLLHRRTVISTHYNTGISCPECLTGESGAFQGNLICINLCENFVMHFEADGPITERICFDGFWLGKAVVFQFFGIHHQRFFLIGDLDAGFFTTGFATSTGSASTCTETSFFPHPAMSDKADRAMMFIFFFIRIYFYDYHPPPNA